MSLILADAVASIHALLVLGVLVGILIAARYKRFRPIESLVLLAAIVIWSLYGGCPLTFLESSLRATAGQPIPLVEAGFIPFYAREWLGWAVTNRELVIATYITAAVFFMVSIEWLSPYINLEVIKLRKAIRRLS